MSSFILNKTVFASLQLVDHPFVVVCFTDRFFNDSSLEERGHAEMFMEYQVTSKLLSGCGSLLLLLMFNGFDLQNKRGGKVKLQSILMPISEFDHEEKGDALYGKL